MAGDDPGLPGVTPCDRQGAGRQDLRFRGKAEAAVEARIAEDEDLPHRGLSKPGQPGVHEKPADAAPPDLGVDRQRPEQRPGMSPGVAQRVSITWPTSAPSRTAPSDTT